ncbi:GRIP and coiled-coil domain-containing protein 2 [Thrips palmi]|uniref:GRIP and coiled-coil domain-containing protein 2 n=1 Tax=Thrips palmi TaxID=161013 RepID=A0A6P8YEG3_THRPL|nr:GRIP and coiled-coil domain-containing protein 2 [Thrips palmi]
MDNQGSEEPQVNRKIPIESLTKEDLIKKYRQAIIIAQKAKESKGELIKLFSEQEKVVQSLEERLQKCEDEKTKEADLRAGLEHELKYAQDTIESLKINRVSNGRDKEETETSESVHLKAPLESDLANCRSAELELSNEKINALESELLQSKIDCQRLNDLYGQVQKLVDEKDNELRCLQEAQDRDKELSENTKMDFTSKIQSLQESLDSAKRENMEENLINEKKIHSLEELLLSKDEDIKKQEESISKMNVLVETIQRELNDKQDVLDRFNSKMKDLENQVEAYKTLLDEKSCKSESQEVEKNKTIDHFKEEISKKDQELCSAENTIMGLSIELQNAKENLAKLEQLSSELSSKVDLLELEKGTSSDNIASLERDLADMKNNQLGEEEKQRTLELETQVGELQEALSAKNKLLKSSKVTKFLLESQVEHFTTLVEDHTKRIEELKRENDELQNGVLERDEAMQKKCEDISHLSTRVSELENELSAFSQERSDLIHVRDKIKEQLTESENQIKSFEARHSSSLQIEQELREQVTSLQAVLSSKDKLIQDLEQEVSKLKDYAANESTNTEVSSTFSLSRAEELSRMKDLEDSFEDKYTKLRVVAVKLKKRVTELTQTLEMERSKMGTEKSDLQAKLTQIASHAKTVQTLQNEVDRLQDLVEEQKKQHQQLSKDLELAVKESASKKFELASVQEELQRTANEKKNLEVSLSSLESALTQAGGLQSEIEKLQKELKEKECIIESFKEEKQSLSEQLEKVCVDAKKKSVLSLEMADMEKSVSELTRQLSSERDRLKSSENEVQQGRVSLSSLEDQLNKIETSLVDKEIENKKLHEKLSLAKEESENLQTKLKEKEATAAQLSNDLEKQRSLVEELNIQCSNLAAKQVQAEEHARHQIDSLSRQVFQLEEHSSALKGSYKALEDELASVKTEFENYKVRAQSVLRQSTKQEDRMISSSTFHNAEELEVEVERLRVNISNLKENLKLTTSQLQAALQDVGVEREEKICAIKQAQASKELYTQAIERQHAAEERLAVVLEESKQAKLHSDMLLQCYKQQLDDLKITHQKKIASLTEQIENLQASITNPVLQRVESDQASSVQSGPSPVAEWAVNLSNTAISDPDLALRLSSLQREEGEGSESVESFPSRRISVTTQDRRHELVPLDKLLSSSTYPEDESPEMARTNSSDLDVDLLQSKLCACESRASHLTALLSEAESDAARLSQLNAVLKEEIRRQQRSEERAQHAHNLEYLKNIVVKFITLQNGDERQRLVPVLNTILKLSPEEANLVATVAKGASQGNAPGRGWGSYLPLPGWTGS